MVKATPAEGEGYWRDRLAINKVNGKQWYTRNDFTRRFRTDVQRWLRYRHRASGGFQSQLLKLNGVPLRDGDVFQLAEGIHELHLIANIGQANDWGVISCAPQFEFIAEEAVASALADRLMAVEDQQPMYQRAWRLISVRVLMRAMPMCLPWLRPGCKLWWICLGRRRFCGWWYRYGVRVECASRFPVLYQNLCGRPLTPHNDWSHFLACRVYPFIATEERWLRSLGATNGYPCRF